MTALAADRDTPRAEGAVNVYPVAAAKTIFAGALVCLSATGYATPGAVATTLIAVGRADEHVDNSAGADGDLTVRVRTGVFRFANSAAGDLIGITEIGKDCYVVDDQTVAKTSGTNTRSIAGKVIQVDDLGVWVRVGIFGV